MKQTFLLFAALVTLAFQACTKTFYVSPDGNDANPGSKGSPFLTLGQAVQAAAEIPDGKKVTVVLKDGEYLLTETVSLNGLKNLSIVAEKDASPVLAGDISLSGWEKASDAAVLARLPESSKNKVWCASLEKAGIADVGELIGEVNRIDLYFNGSRQTLARWPNKGNAFAGKVIGHTPTKNDHWHGFNEGVFEYLEDNVSKWADEPDAYAHGYWFWDWRENYKRIVSVDTKTRTIHLPEGDDDGYGYKDNLRYFGVNLLCELDVAGEYYIDPAKKLVYYYAPDGFDPKGTQVTYSAFSPAYMLEMEGCEDVILSGITLRGGRNGAVSVKGGKNVLFKDCRFAQFANDAMFISDSKDLHIEGCLFQELGHGGIEAHGGDRKTLEPSGFVVENTIFTDFSLYKPTYEPAIIFYGCGMELRYNHFQNCASSALRLEGNDILVEKNRFVHLVTESDDQGAIDVYWNFTYRGNVVRWNWWEDIVSEAEDSGAAGIRLDDIISGYKMYGNVFNNCGAGIFGAIQIHGGKDNIVEDNLMYGCNSMIHASRWGQKRFEVDLYGDEMMAKLKEVDFPSELYKSRYPELADEKEIPLHANRNYVRNNLAVNSKSKVGQIEDYVMENNSEIDSDKPLEYFLDSEVLDGYGIKPLPWKEMGLKDNKYKDIVNLR